MNDAVKINVQIVWFLGYESPSRFDLSMLTKLRNLVLLDQLRGEWVSLSIK